MLRHRPDHHEPHPWETIKLTAFQGQHSKPTALYTVERPAVTIDDISLKRLGLQSGLGDITLKF